MNESFVSPIMRTVADTDWVVPVACLVCLLYVTSRLLFPRYHIRLSHAFFNRYEATKLIEEKNVLFNRGGFFLNLIPFFCIAMMTYEQIGLFHPDTLHTHAFTNYLKILVLVVIYFGGRILLVYLFGYSFEQKEISLRFNQVWLLQYENLGIYLVIPSMILPFTAGIVKLVLMVSLWAALALWILFTIYRELEILKLSRISIFYMFLYLCTLEILPLWWAIQSITEGW